MPHITQTPCSHLCVRDIAKLSHTPHLTNIRIVISSPSSFPFTKSLSPTLSTPPLPPGFLTTARRQPSIINHPSYIIHPKPVAESIFPLSPTSPPKKINPTAIILCACDANHGVVAPIDFYKYRDLSAHFDAFSFEDELEDKEPLLAMGYDSDEIDLCIAMSTYERDVIFNLLKKGVNPDVWMNEDLGSIS